MMSEKYQDENFSKGESVNVKKIQSLSNNLMDRKPSKINKIYGAFSFYCRKRRSKYLTSPLYKLRLYNLVVQNTFFCSNFIFVSGFNFCVYLSSLSMHWDDILVFTFLKCKQLHVGKH